MRLSEEPRATFAVLFMLFQFLFQFFDFPVAAREMSSQSMSI